MRILIGFGIMAVFCAFAAICLIIVGDDDENM